MGGNVGAISAAAGAAEVDIIIERRYLKRVLEDDVDSVQWEGDMWEL